MGYFIVIFAVVTFALCLLFMLGARYGKDESADIYKRSEPERNIEENQLHMLRQSQNEESLSEKDSLLQKQFYRDYENIISYDGCEQKK